MKVNFKNSMLTHRVEGRRGTRQEQRDIPIHVAHLMGKVDVLLKAKSGYPYGDLKLESVDVVEYRGRDHLREIGLRRLSWSRIEWVA